MDNPSQTRPPVCDYENSDYQQVFWDEANRKYEDQVESIALKRLLPTRGDLLLELGAGAGRNSPRYTGHNRVILLDYSISQLQRAQERLGKDPRFTYVAGDIYRLPFRSAVFDTITMIRTLHHMADAHLALQQTRDVIKNNGVFILEYANKQNLKAILRFALRRQSWNPFSDEPVEFVELNFDFHPRSIRNWLADCGFQIESQITVSHFRNDLLKKIIPLNLLVSADSLAQLTGNWWQLTPSVFVRSKAVGAPDTHAEYQGEDIFKCPECNSTQLVNSEESIFCGNCSRKWLVRDGIYDFRMPENQST